MVLRSAPRSVKDSLIPDFARLAPTFFVPGIASLVSAPILFGILGAEGYGIFAIALAIANGVPQLTASWAESTILRFGHLRRPSHLSESVSLMASGLAGALAAAIVLRDQSPALWFEIGALTAAVSGYVLRAAHLQSTMRFSAISWLAAYRAIVGSALAVILGFWTGTVGGAIVGLGAGFAAVTIATSIAHREPAGVTPPDTPLGTLRPSRFGVASMGVALGLYTLSAGDRFVLNAFRPLDEVGVYAISYTVTEMVMRLVPSVLLVVIRPRVFRFWDRAETDTARALIGDAIALLVWTLALAQIAWLSVLHLPAMAFVDPQVAGPVSIGITSLTAAFAVSLLHTAGLNQPRLALGTIFCAVCAITADIILTPSLGAIGAALVTAGAYSMLMVLNWVGSGLRLATRNAALAVVAFLSISANGLITLADLSSPTLVVGFLIMIVLTPLAARIARSLVFDSRAKES